MNLGDVLNADDPEEVLSGLDASELRRLRGVIDRALMERGQTPHPIAASEDGRPFFEELLDRVEGDETEASRVMELIEEWRYLVLVDPGQLDGRLEPTERQLGAWVSNSGSH